MNDPGPQSPGSPSDPLGAKRVLPPAEPPRRRIAWLVWLWLLLLVGLVGVVEIPSEVVAWKYAAALEAREAGKKELAYRELASIRQQNPDDLVSKLRLVQWYNEDGRYTEALTLLNEIIDSNGATTSRLMFRSQLYHHLQRHQDAVADLEAVYRRAQSTGEIPTAIAANQLAYARAVGKIDLEQALREIEFPVRNARAELNEFQDLVQAKKIERALNPALLKALAEKQSSLAAYLDTRGFINTQLDRPKQAEADLDEAIHLCTDALNFELKNSKLYSVVNRTAREYFSRVQANKHSLGVLHYHRGLNRQKLGQEAEAKKDFDRARDLSGKEPDDTLF
jgi:hypothetical protein